MKYGFRKIIIENDLLMDERNMESSLFDRVGGFENIARIHHIFYTKVYQHKWLGLYFKNVLQSDIESQTTKFMAGLFGGPKTYSGLLPKPAHRVMNIPEELFQIRQDLLRESLIEFGLKESEVQDWIKKDESFRNVIVKQSIAECQKLYTDEPILSFEKPN